MPYLNEYNEKLANDINALNREYVLNESVTLDPRSQAGFTGGAKLSGGFLGAIASALLPSLLPMVLGKLTGQGKLKIEHYASDSDSECENKKGGSMYNSMRDNLEGSGMASKDYKHQSEDKYNCGMGRSGGSAYGLGEGSLRDTGEGVTDSQLLQLGEGKKKRGRKSKMGTGKSGGGIISNMGIPVISGLAGLFGLGRSGGKKMLSKTQDVPLSYGSTVPKSGGALGSKKKVNTFEPKILAQTAPTSTKAVSPVGVVDKALNIGSNMSGMGKKRGRKSKMEGNSDKMCGSAKKSNPWMQLMAKVRKEHPELKGVKAVIAYIKQHNLYKK
jgi:hypothetical protein